MPTLHDPEHPLTEADIEEFGRSLPRPLPDSFKRHYLACNGGGPSEEDEASGAWGLPVHGFNPIRYGRLPVEALMKDYGAIVPRDGSFGDWAEGESIPFAYDAGGSSIFLSLRQEDTGAVYICSSDRDAIGKVTDTFEEFRRRLFREA